jgi:group I intron endonuclease
MIIYKIENNINRKIYIGLTTKDLSRRISEHVAENKSCIQKALNKYGIQSFTISVIDHAESRDILCEKEKYWINYYDCKVPNGYNLTDGGDGLINPTSEVRMSISNTLKKHYQEHPATAGFSNHSHSTKSRKKISQSLKIALSDSEIRSKLSKANKGIKKSESHKRKIGEANKGKLKGRVPWNKGLKMIGRDPNYVNSMQGKKRPDLSERNRLGGGKKKVFSNPVERAQKISKSRIGKKFPRRVN